MIRSTILWGLIVLLLASVRSPLVAQQVSITTHLDRAAIQIGEYASIQMKIRTNDLEHTLLVVPSKESMRQAEMLAFEILDTIPLGGGGFELNAVMTITSFDEGMIELPAFGVTVGGETYTSPALFLKVSMPEVDTTQPEHYYDIKEPQEVSLRWWEYLLLLLLHPITWVVLALAAFVGGVYAYYLYRKRRSEPESPAIRPLTPIERFDQAVEILRGSPFGIQREQIALYDELIGHFRNYLHDHLDINSEDLTARDLWRLLQRDPYRLSPTPLDEWVKHSEWVRFADAHAHPEWQSDDLEIVSRAVHQLEAQALVPHLSDTMERKEESV